MSKEEIFNLISKGELNEAFDELNKFFKYTNDTLNALTDEFITPSHNFNEVQFKARLRLFISRYYLEQSAKPRSKQDIDFYDALCELDFKLQTHHFQSIYKYKKIAAFLLHGESGENGTDVKWLYNQILHKEGLLNDKHIVIDFNSNLGGSFERLLEEFYLRFNINAPLENKNKQIALLRSELENRLNTDHFVCIIKNPGNILNSEIELCRLFDDLFSFMDDNIVRKDHTHSLILLFIDNKLADYTCKDPKYFFWFKDSDRKEHSKNAISCQELKIIDLAPIEKVKEGDIKDWINWSLPTPSIYDKISPFWNKENDILKEGNNPYQVIKRICTELNIQIEDKWIH